MKSGFKLLERDDFREGTFARDKHRCVICGRPSSEGVLNAHHIIDRTLFKDGGYYLENGATLCEEVCHMEAEKTLISVEDVRKAAGIVNYPMPEGFYPEDVIDKWGNYILPNKTRLRGPKFYDEPVQKVLKEAGLLDSFTHLVKYPQTKHLDFSPGVGKDDDIIDSLEEIEGHEGVVTIKMDGENFTMYSDYCHARSLDGRHHPSRNWAKDFHAQRMQLIPPLWRVVAENVYAQHSIRYEDLESYVLGISIWNEFNVALPWDETLDWFQLLDNIVPVPLLWRGKITHKKLMELAEGLDPKIHEGFVVRRADAIPYSAFGRRVAKYVRKGHVQSDSHWMHAEIVPNKLIG
jgi:hypothetical protein